MTDEDELPLCSSIVANVDSYPVALGCSKEVYRAVKRNATLRPVEHLVSKRGSKHHHHKHHNKSDEHVLTYEPIMLTWTANGNYARTEEIIHSSVASTTARAPCRLLPSQIKTATGAPVNEVHASLEELVAPLTPLLSSWDPSKHRAGQPGVIGEYGISLLDSVSLALSLVYVLREFDSWPLTTDGELVSMAPVFPADFGSGQFGVTPHMRIVPVDVVGRMLVYGQHAEGEDEASVVGAKGGHTFASEGEERPPGGAGLLLGEGLPCMTDEDCMNQIAGSHGAMFTDGSSGEVRHTHLSRAFRRGSKEIPIPTEFKCRLPQRTCRGVGRSTLIAGACHELWKPLLAGRLKHLKHADIDVPPWVTSDVNAFIDGACSRDVRQRLSLSEIEERLIALQHRLAEHIATECNNWDAAGGPDWEGAHLPSDDKNHAWLRQTTNLVALFTMGPVHTPQTTPISKEHCGGDRVGSLIDLSVHG